MFNSLKDNSKYSLFSVGLDVYGYPASASISSTAFNSSSGVTSAAPHVYIFGNTCFQGAGLSPDAEYTPGHQTFITLGNITANRNLVLSSPNAGSILIVSVDNSNNSFNWIVSGSAGIKNPSGSSVTSLDNKAVYILVQGSTFYWRIASKYTI